MRMLFWLSMLPWLSLQAAAQESTPGTVHLKFLLDGSRSLPAPRVPNSFRLGLAKAIAVPARAISVSRAVRTGKETPGAERGWLVEVQVSVQNEQAGDDLAQQTNRNSFIQTLVAALTKVGFAVVSRGIHVVPNGYSFSRAKNVCARAHSCTRCSALTHCAWCGSMATCLDSLRGVCAGDRWDTRSCATDRASLAVDRMDDSSAGSAPSDATQLSGLVALIAVLSTALLLISLYQKVQHHFSSFSSGSRVIDTSTFEEIEESLELAEFDEHNEELAYSREESSSLLSLY